LAKERIARFSKLHLACGTNIINGWANIDLSNDANIINFDLTIPLPVNSETISFIYCEHFIEHISYDQAKRLIGDCYRVLKPGGVLRVSTPSLRKLIDEYLAGRLSEWHDVGFFPSTPCHMMNEGMRSRSWGHEFLYDADELAHLFVDAGFSMVTNVAWRESNYEELKGLECRPFHDELILEAVK
jgi:predicted SAM-dependent methyltransferase